MTGAQGLAIDYLGHTTRLKWHRLRRSFADPVFSADVMAAGFKAGASMELDLRVRADGGFVVLHDADLEGETDGLSAVRNFTASGLRKLKMRDGSRPLILSEDLEGLAQAAHKDALLQLDMKDDLATIGARGIAHLAEHVADVGSRIIISGRDPDLILAIKNRVPEIRLGVDPSKTLMQIYDGFGPGAVERELLAGLAGTIEPDTIYLAWPLLLRAAADGLDLVGLCHAGGTRVDAWTFTLKDPVAGFDAEESGNFSRLMALKPDQITTDAAPATERAWAAIDKDQSSRPKPIHSR